MNQNKIKILHLRATNFYGGPERQLHQHARVLKGSPMEITISSFSEDGQKPELLSIAETDGIKTHLFEVSTAYDFSAIGKIRKYLTDNNFDILCTHDYRTNILGFRATRATGCVWLPFSRGWTKENRKVRLYHWLDKQVLRKANTIIAVSEGQKEKLTQLRIRPERIKVALNAVLPQQFDSVQAIDLRTKFNLPDDAIICVAGGRFSEEKGQAVFVKAASMLVDEHTKLYFILYGDGPSKPEIEQLVKSLGLSGRVYTPGFEKNMIAVLKSADLLVNPSLSEGLPNIVLEAMAVKLPVVATDVGGLPELITDNECGFLVPPDDPNALAAAIKKITADRNMRIELAECGLKRIVESFSFEKQAEILSAIYKSVVKQN